MKPITRTIATVNDSPILVIENGEKLVPIKPLCEALKIDAKTQREKIEKDEILGSVGGLRPSTGADGKQYEMYCIPYKFIFGWLFTINPRNVKPEAQEAVTNYKLQCYDVLFRHFTDQSDFLEQKQNAINDRLDEYQRIQQNFKETKTKLNEAKKELNLVKDQTFDEWLSNNRQLSIDFNASKDEKVN